MNSLCNYTIQKDVCQMILIIFSSNVQNNEKVQITLA